MSSFTSFRTKLLKNESLFTGAVSPFKAGSGNRPNPILAISPCVVNFYVALNRTNILIRAPGSFYVYDFAQLTASFRIARSKISEIFFRWIIFQHAREKRRALAIRKRSRERIRPIVEIISSVAGHI